MIGTVKFSNAFSSFSFLILIRGNTMKKILVALGLSLAAMSSQAALTFVSNGSTIATNAVNDVTGQGVGTTYSTGNLFADAGDTIVFTNLASLTEAGYTNLFINGSSVFSNKSGSGDTYSFFSALGGLLTFSFTDANGVTFNQGSSSIAVLTNPSTFGLVDQFVLLLDDSAALHTDFDDHAVGVSAVPVPAALPLMASALGAFGIARRRSNKAKAV